MGLFLALGLFLRDLERVKKRRWLMAAGAIGLLGITLVLGKAKFGATNWITLGGISFQPSEIAKICYIFAGSATLERLFRQPEPGAVYRAHRRVHRPAGADERLRHGGHLLCDLPGHRLSPLRGLPPLWPSICGGAVFGAGIIVTVQALYPEPLRRLGPRLGGGLQLRLSADPHHVGRRLRRTVRHGGRKRLAPERIAAGDTDLVFGMLCEEWGLVIALLAVACILTLAWFAVRASRAGRSSFYTIAACAAGSLLVFQTSLNVFGSVDLLPLTGVTFPFVSNGGSAMMSAWGLLAYLKAMDTRADASFAIGRGGRSGNWTRKPRRMAAPAEDAFEKGGRSCGRLKNGP